MENKDLKPTVNNNFINIKNPSSIGTLKKNSSFCTSFFSKHIETTIIDNVSELNISKELVYSTPYKNNLDAEAINKIIDLLMQLRAASSDQSILVQNNTVLRDQILNQLKSEILRAGNNLTKNQIENLKVVSNNNFDEKTLTDILKSFLESSKKKSDKSDKSLTHLAKNRDFGTVFSKDTSKNYISVIDRVNYYNQVLDKIFKNVLYNPFVNKKSSELKYLNSGDSSSSEILSKTDEVRNNVSKNKIIQNRIDILDEVTKFYEENIIGSSSLLPKIIKLQTKISEIGILEKVNTIAENFIKKSLPKVLKTETELINKIVNTERIDNIYEDITLSKEQYENEKAYQERRISRIYNDVRKFNNSKYIIQNISEVLKSNKIKGFNLEENIKKNIIKLSTQKSILNRFKNVYDNTIESTIEKNIKSRTSLVNRQNSVNVEKEEIKAVKDVSNIERYSTLEDKKFVKDIRQNNILMKVFYVQRRKLRNIHNLSEKINNFYSEFENYQNIEKKEKLINLKNTDYREIDNELINKKIKETENIFENKTINKFSKSLEEKISKINHFTKDIFIKNKNSKKLLENKIRLKNIYLEDENTRNIEKKEKLINLKNTDYREIDNELINKKIKETENIFENKTINKFSKSLEEKISKINHFTKDIFIKNKNSKKLLENKIRLKNIYLEDENTRNIEKKEKLINLKNTDYREIDNELIDKKIKETENIFENKTINKLIKKLKFRNEKLNNKISNLEENVLIELFKPISSKKVINTKVKKSLNPISIDSTQSGKFNEIQQQKNIYKFEPVYKIDKVLDETDIEKVISKNNINVLNPTIVKENISRTRFKSVYKNFAKDRIHKYLDNTYDVKKDYLINKFTTDSFQNQYRHFDDNYMVYRENVIPYKKSEEKKKKDLGSKNKKIGKINPQNENISEPIKIDTKEIEKNILSKTMSKKDIINLIDSRNNSIDIEAISNEIIEKVNMSLEMDRRRNGIF
ncbi:MAG: hypothetical protein Q4B84_02470 [Clostridia bacterium]|nr:hypothetical protein [Clostridia bacterium]